MQPTPTVHYSTNEGRHATVASPNYPADLAQIIPPDLLELAHWVCWKWEKRRTDDLKLTKVPYNPKTGGKADASKRATWGTFTQALNRFRGAGYSGIGFEFGEGIVGVDLDGCRDAQTGEIAAWAQEIVSALCGYAEVSPSGSGIHILVRGALPSGGRRRGAVELYDTARYFTVTGVPLAGASRELVDQTEQLATLHARIFAEQDPAQPAQTSTPRWNDMEIVARAMRARNGTKFAALWRGEIPAGKSASEADLSLIDMLRFWTQDAAQLDILFRRSGLMRPKWDERHSSTGDTYGEITIAKSLSGFFEVWTPRRDPQVQREQEEAQALPDEPPDDASQADTLVRIAMTAQLFRTPGGLCHARAWVDGHYETWPIRERGGGFRRWLIQQYREQRERAPNPQAVTQALESIEAEAYYSKRVYEVYVRLAEADGAIYYDLGDDAWRCIEITANGWRVVDNPPVYFRRPAGMRALPEPTRGGSLDALRPLIGPESDDDWILIVAWLLGCMHPRGPYPHLSLSGHAGAGKSTKTRLLRDVIDPSEAPTRSMPKEERDLAVAAHNNRILALDNLSHIPAWLSDMLCQLSTGAGAAFRKLYADDEEVIFNARRPVVFNGIEDTATRGDLIDRLVSVSLARIPEDKRINEGDIDRRFREAHPAILGALCDAVSLALRDQDKIPRKHLPRMADFYLWVTAACPALGWRPSQFAAAYKRNHERATLIELSASVLAQAIIAFMEERTQWEGTASALDALLRPIAGEEITRSKAWPSLPHFLSGHLKRLAPALASQGIVVEHGRDKHASRISLRVVSPTPSPEPPDAPNDPPSSSVGVAGCSCGVAGCSSHIPLSYTLPDQKSPETGQTGVAGVAESRPISPSAGKSIISQVEEREREREEIGGNSATPATPATPGGLEGYSTSPPNKDAPCPKGGRHMWSVAIGGDGWACRKCRPELVNRPR